MTDATELFFRVNPRLSVIRLSAGRVELSLPFVPRRLRAAAHIVSLIERLAAEPPQRGDALMHRLGARAFDLLVRHLFLLPEHLVELISAGVCTPAAQPAGHELSVHDLDLLEVDDIAVLHVPLVTTAEGAVPVGGGGRWVRAHLAQSLACQGEVARSGVLLDLDFGCELDCAALRLFDLGDIVRQPLDDRASDVGARAAWVCQSVVARGARPVLLGGDHGLAYYSIGALAARYPRLGVLQFDAHTDLYATGSACDDRLNHANVMQWVRRMPHVQALWQVGVRDFFHQPTQGLARVHDAKVHVLPAFEAETRGYQRLLDSMDRTLPWFLSFDVDVLAAADLPQTATPVLGGLTFYPLLACLEQVFREFRVVGLEFVEIGDAAPSAHGAAAICARLLSRYVFQLRPAAATAGTLYAPST